MVIHPFLLVKQHISQVETTLGLRETTGCSQAANRHLSFSEIDEPLGLARGGQVSPVSVEKKLPQAQ